MGILKGAALALGMIAAAPALAQAQEVATFSVGGVDFELPIPPGYCLPAGPNVAVAQKLAAADLLNVTNLTLFACDYPTGHSDYFLVKTPSQVLTTSITREQFLPAMAEQYKSPEFLARISPEQVNGPHSRAMSEATGQKVEIESSVAPRGVDDVCAYMSGVIAVNTSDAGYRGEASGCTTAVGTRIIMVYYYRSGYDPENAIRNLPRARQFALTIRVRGK